VWEKLEDCNIVERLLYNGKSWKNRVDRIGLTDGRSYEKAKERWQGILKPVQV
jgi:hypothetical protein